MAREFDSPWKDLLDYRLQPVARLLFPHVYPSVDWAASYDSLDTELQQIIREAELGETHADKLFRVKLLDGTDLYLLIHIEVQAQYDAAFPRRMFVYSYRLQDRYNQPIESLAILADNDPNWRPSEYRQETMTTKTLFEFGTVKLLDWANRIEELEGDESPVGLVIVAHLQSHFTNKNLEQRREWKFRLIRKLLVRGLSPEEVRKFFRMIDWLLELPKDVDRAFREDVFKWEKEQTVPYISSFERLAKEEGFEAGKIEGKAEGKAEMLLLVLELRFGDEGIRFGDELKTRPLTEWVSRLESLIRSAATIEELRLAIG